MENSVIDDKVLKTSNIIMWITVLFPLFIIPLESFLIKNDGGAINVLIGAIPMALSVSDRQIWMKSGMRVSSLVWPILIYPVYIWKRNNTLKQTQQFFWIWLGTTVLSVTWTVYPFLTGGQSSLEKAACELTTQIMRENFEEYSKCKNVAIIESEGDTHFAIAELKNKDILNITIKEIRGGRIYVEINDFE